jgi:tetratricopeptide (TPR) repeat protein
MVLTIEDLHWADASTLELLELLVEQGATARLLILCTARPEFRPPWAMRAHHAQIALNRLGVRDIRMMVAQVAASKALSEETVTAVVERTGGVPLFVEELTRAVLEGGEAKATGHEIPATLHDSLMARLDRLGRAKDVAQVASVIGREFSYELLHAVYSIAEADLQNALRVLTNADLIYVRGIAPDATYQFKHALIQDAAYVALLKSHRKEVHNTVAETIAMKFPAIKEAHPEVLARHWTEAGEIDRAIAGWKVAAEHAVEQRAYREGEVHYREALAMLLSLPDSPERDSRELILRIALGGIMVATRGWSAADTTETYTRARILAERAGSTESLEVFYGLWVTTLTRGDLRTALGFAEHMLEIARGVVPSAKVTAHYALGSTQLVLGELTLAHHNLLLAGENYREEDFRDTSDDRGVYSIGYAGVTEWLLGYPDRARRYTDEARTLARRLNKPFALVHANGFGLTDVFRYDLIDLRKACEEAERLSTELGFPTYRAISRILGAWATARMGELHVTPASIRALREDLENWGQPLFRGFILSILGEMEALAGATDSALVTVEQALQVNPDELWFRPLTLRLRGELRLRSDAARTTRFELAERDFGEGIELSRKMSAKSPELRATTSLAQLLRDTNRRDEGRTMLADIYNWFSEGFDTADLIDAKALLDELGT